MSDEKRKTYSTPLSKNLPVIRRSCGMTQQQVSDLLSINRTTYTKYETGVSEPSLDLLLRIAALFRVSVDDLLTKPSNNTLFSDSADGEKPSITDEERRILELFRTLNAEEKQEILRKLEE